MTDAPEICPLCEKRLWRKGKVVKATSYVPGENRTITVCMWCLMPFDLIDGQWVLMSPERLLQVRDVVEPAAKRFATYRAFVQHYCETLTEAVMASFREHHDEAMN